MKFETTCPTCGKKFEIVNSPKDPPENKECSCGTILEFTELGLSIPKANWVTPEGDEQPAKLERKG